MSFCKNFPLQLGNRTVWQEISLTSSEELLQEKLARKANMQLLKESLRDAEKIMREKDMKKFQTTLTNMALALFKTRSSHEVFWKEELCKRKFDEKFNGNGKKIKEVKKN